MNKVYKGIRTEEGVQVTVETDKGRSYPLRHINYHSPDGFEFGYGGSGPSDLSLAILANYFKENFVTSKYLKSIKLLAKVPKCYKWHIDFKTAFIAPISEEQWQITSEQIAKWVEAQPKEGNE